MKRFIFYITLLSSYGYTTASFALPDVVVTNISYASGKFTATVKNQGNSATPSGTLVNVGYFVDGSFKTWGAVNRSLAAGASVTIGTNGVSYAMPTGTHTIKARTDYDFRIAESNEGNNDRSSTVGSTGSTPTPTPTPTASATFPVGQTGISLGTNTSASRLDPIQAMKAKWVRFQLGWSWIQAKGPTSFSWSPVDSAVNAITSRGMQPIGVLSTTPTWARPSTCTNSQWCAPASSRTGDFANFAAAAVRRYPQIRVWEIWNEPNHGPWWKPNADPVRYTAFLKAAYKAMKAVDSSVTVISGGMAPAVTKGSSIRPTEFLQKVYANGGAGSFDGVGHHPYCYDAKDTCPDLFANWSSWSQMNDTNPSLRSLMRDNGDSNKKIWVTEFGAPTGGGSRGLTQTQQAKMLANAYALFRSYSWAGGAFLWHNDRDTCTNTSNVECYFGLISANGSKKLAYYEFVKASGQ